MAATYTPLRPDPYEGLLGWNHRFVKRMDADHGMGEALVWCKENLSGEWKQWFAYIMMKDDIDAFRFKMRFC
jgi:hypothetical protein